MARCLRRRSAAMFAVALLTLQLFVKTTTLLSRAIYTAPELCVTPVSNHIVEAVPEQIPRSHPQFVFLVGTEGSGHHLWSSLIEKSPNLQTLRELNLVAAAEDVTYQLFNKRNLRRSLFAGSACHGDDWNGTMLLEQTAQKLRLVAKKLPSNVTVPLNGMANTKRTTGMMSYPNFKSTEQCAALRHPDVTLLQRACQMAEVSCHWIVQHRDPLAILRSTTKKRNMHSMGYAIPLYTGMLNTIRFQITQIQDNSTLEFCWDYQQDNPPERLGILLGWKDRDVFATIFHQEYQQPTSAGDIMEGIIPEHRVLLQSLFAAHEQLKAACRYYFDD